MINQFNFSLSIVRKATDNHGLFSFVSLEDEFELHLIICVLARMFEVKARMRVASAHVEGDENKEQRTVYKNRTAQMSTII